MSLREPRGIAGSSGNTFFKDLLAGHFHKDLIRVVLEESGYEVYPYGYESFLTPLKIRFEKGEIRSTEVSRKIRCTPDLLVYDPESQSVDLVEVKSRKWDHTDYVFIDALPKYQKHWSGCVLVVVLPAGHFFYAQYVEKVKRMSHEESDYYDLNDTFEWFERVFTKADLSTLYSYKEEIINFWGREPDRYSPLGVENRFNLLNLIQENKPCSISKLFEDQNKRNLISREVFDKTVKQLIDEGKIQKKKVEIH